MTLEELKGDDYVSSLRNKLLAEMFYLTGDIEKYGTGFIRIRKNLQNRKDIKFSFKEMGGCFVTKLEATQETTQENTKKMILHLIKENSTITRKEMVVKLKKSDSTIKEHLANLKKDGYIKRIGSNKAGYWKIL